MHDILDTYTNSIAFILDSAGVIINKTHRADELLCSERAPLNFLQTFKNNFLQSVASKQSTIKGFSIPDFRSTLNCLELLNFSIYELIDQKYLILESFIPQERNITNNGNLNLEIIASVTHDLKNPISAIFGFADTLLTVMQNPEPQLNASELQLVISKIANTGKRALELLRNYEQLFLMLNHGIKPQYQKVKLLDYINQEIANNPGELTRIALETVGADLMIDMHPSHLERILSNLIQNALKFSAPDGKVSIYTEDAENHSLLVIKNTNSFIPESEYQNIFKKYERLVNSDGKNSGTNKFIKGTGLGLYIVWNILNAYAYSISVRSNSIPENFVEFKVKFTKS